MVHLLCPRVPSRVEVRFGSRPIQLYKAFKSVFLWMPKSSDFVRPPPCRVENPDISCTRLERGVTAKALKNMTFTDHQSCDPKENEAHFQGRETHFQLKEITIFTIFAISQRSGRVRKQPRVFSKAQDALYSFINAPGCVFAS